MSVHPSKKERNVSVILKYRTKYTIGTGNKKSGNEMNKSRITSGLQLIHFIGTNWVSVYLFKV